MDRKAKVTILFSHGNAEDIGMIFDSFNEFAKELWVNVLAYDYEGYGKAWGWIMTFLFVFTTYSPILLNRRAKRV